MKKFELMTKTEKRVAIAKDTLKWLKIGKIKPQDGVVMSFDRICEVGLQGKSLQKVLSKLTTTCRVCQRGGLFYSYIRRVNKFKVDGVIGGSVCSPREGVPVDKKAQRRLEEVFSKKQLALIERAFEGDYNTGILSSDEIDAAESFRLQYLSPTNTSVWEDLFGAILENIVENKGTFKL